jgi:maltose phosphorylase
MRILDSMIHLAPQIPVKWKSYSFHARFRGILFEVKVAKDVVSINNMSDKDLDLEISGKLYQVKGSEKTILNL